MGRHDDQSNHESSYSSPVGSLHSLTLLHEHFSPGPFDVICARGRDALMHSGNRRFRDFVVLKLVEYLQARTKLDKSRIVSDILSFVRDYTPGGGFVKQIDGRWYEVGDHVAREKVGQAIRDLLYHKYKSSARAKKVRRRTMLRSISSPEGNNGSSTENYVGLPNSHDALSTEESLRTQISQLTPVSKPHVASVSGGSNHGEGLPMAHKYSQTFGAFPSLLDAGKICGFTGIHGENGGNSSLVHIPSTRTNLTIPDAGFVSHGCFDFTSIVGQRQFDPGVCHFQGIMLNRHNESIKTSAADALPFYCSPNCQPGECFGKIAQELRPPPSLQSRPQAMPLLDDFNVDDFSDSDSIKFMNDIDAVIGPVATKFSEE